MIAFRPTWVWVTCGDYHCGHSRALPLAPWKIRWGVEDPVPLIREHFCCFRCKQKGATVRVPNVIHGEGYVDFMPIGADAVRIGGRRRNNESCIGADERNRVEYLHQLRFGGGRRPFRERREHHDSASLRSSD